MQIEVFINWRDLCFIYLCGGGWIRWLDTPLLQKQKEMKEVKKIVIIMLEIFKGKHSGQVQL